MAETRVFNNQSISSAKPPISRRTYSDRHIYAKRHLLDTKPNNYTDTVLESRVESYLPKPKIKVSKKNNRVYKKKLALLLPGHNEELIIQSTIKSALAAGQSINDIFVVDDNSSDKTRSMAVALLGRRQVLTVERSGKAKAVYKAIKHFNLEDRYEWIHVADADSVFGKDYFRIYRKGLKGKKYVVALGFVQSLRGNWIAHYRSFCYTYSQHVLRRIQSWFGMIAVFPGPITCFKSSIIKDLDFDSGTITEDFDITLQVYRKHLGSVRYIPEAVNFTQDPQTLRDFCRQTARWQRGFFQVYKKYKVGRKLQAVDFSIGYQMLQVSIYLIQMLVIVPIVAILTGNLIAIPVMLITDFFVISLLGIFSAIIAKRITILASLPYYYFLRWVELAIFVIAFVEVDILKKYKTEIIGWQTEGRRYALDTLALKDVAK